MRSKAATVDEFLASLEDEDARTLFRKIRTELTRGRHVTESMRFGMPTYAVGDSDDMVGAFNRQKNHYSLYLPPEAIDPYRADLGHLDCGKSCLRFKRPADLPFATIKKIIVAAVRLHTPT